MDADPMSRKLLIHQLETRPLVFMLDGSYKMYVGFLNGYRVGSSVAWLDDFHDQLVLKLGGGANLGWESLVPRLAFPADPSKWRPLASRNAAEDKELCRSLFSLLREFDAVYPEVSVSD